MVKRTTLLLSGALALLMSLPAQNVSAQLGLRTPGAKIKDVMTKTKPGQVDAKQKAFELKHPLLAQVKNFGTPKTTFDNKGLKEIKMDYAKIKGASARRSVAKAPSLSAATGRELWGCVTYQTGWTYDNTAYGMYSFNATSPITMTALGLNNNLQATGGGALVGDVFHEVNYFSYYGRVFMYHYAFDINTWEQTANDFIDGGYSLLAKETAVTSDGTVYGEFYNENLSGLELGIVDYSTLTRTTIGSLTKSYVALGITGDKRIYGVASDGNLYKIDANNATETLVGPTGLTLLDSDSKYYQQSGEIDPRTNIFYWAGIDADGNCALYTVDLATGAASKVSDFPAEEEIHALSIPELAADEAAPAAVADLELSFENGSLDGTVSFTAPSKTFGGADLSGELAYYIVASGDTIGTGIATAGSKVTAKVTVPNDGFTRFVVTTANSAGSSPKATAKQYVGLDIPNDIEKVNITVDEKTNTVKLTWNASDGSVNGGYLGDLTYTVVRYPDADTVAVGLTDTAFTETIGAGELSAYYYGVTAVNGRTHSNETRSGKVVLGSAIVPPYENTFEDESSFDLMTVIDANEDDCTWSWSNTYGEAQYAQYQFSSFNSGDDWLLTPSLKLEANKEYTVSFDAASSIDVYVERLEVKYGEGGDPTKYTGVILPSTDITSDQYMKFSKTIVPEADTEIKIGFHCISDPDLYYLKLTNIKVGEGCALTAPDSATAISVAADASGALAATVSFTLPSKVINGSAITAITKAEILRDGKVVGTVTDGLTPGGIAKYTDSGMTNGTHSYSVRVYNENGGGRTSEEASAYVGIDTPSTMSSSDISLKDNTTSIGMSWKPVTIGIHGGSVNPDGLFYNIYKVGTDEYGYTMLELFDSVKAVTTYDIPFNTAEGDQGVVNYALSAKNEAGEGTPVATRTFVYGKPYSIPFREEFPGGQMSYGSWWTTTPGFSRWGLSNRESADNSGGSVVFNGTGEEAYLASGKISLAGAANTKLVFSSKSDANSNATLTTLIRKADGSVDSVAVVNYDEEATAEATSWKNTIVSLAKYANEPYIIVQFRGKGNTEGYLYLDDIKVRDVYENDLAAEITASQDVKKGSNATVNVKVSNYGESTASAYTIKLYAGSTLVETKEVTEPIASFESKTFEFVYKTNVFDENSSVELSATVEFANDNNTDDNTASTSVALLSSTKPSPASVTATPSDRTAEVAWTAPASLKTSVTEDFESYTSWSIDKFGDWTCYDGDKANTGSIFDYYSYDHQGGQFAFEVWEPDAWFEGCTENNPTFAPHSGKKYVAALYGVGSGGIYPDADNWLISPLLSGDKQTVTFYAINQGGFPETLELSYATDGGSDISTFVPVDTVTVDAEEWTEVTFEVPEGATNFAIRHMTSDGGYMICIDDISYVAGAGTLTGYNIYRDGKFVANVPADTTSFVDTTCPDNGTYTYAVTAVYADGESAPVAATPVIVSAIDNANAANGKTYTVYTVDGKRISKDAKSIDGLKKGIYIVNDKKAVVK